MTSKHPLFPVITLDAISVQSYSSLALQVKLKTCNILFWVIFVGLIDFLTTTRESFHVVRCFFWRVIGCGKIIEAGTMPRIHRVGTVEVVDDNVDNQRVATSNPFPTRRLIEPIEPKGTIKSFKVP